jgi:hypothetical protein
LTRSLIPFIREPCVASILIGCLTHDSACLVLEPLACTLHEVILGGATDRLTDSGLDLTHVLTIGRDIASGLASLHSVFQAHGGKIEGLNVMGAKTHIPEWKILYSII